MKKFLLALGLGAVVALTACGGGNEPAPAPTEQPAEEVPAEEAPAETPEEGATAEFDATAAEDTYKKSCIGCHGGNLEGTVGPALKGTALSDAEIKNVILNGQGTMPAQNLPEADAENLAKWIKAQ
ncbi:cytochrome c [bacterium LRH843]|nr:cytochrome c [bacterium LRH843]